MSNLYGVTEWLPSGAASFATTYLHQPVPLLDAIIALLVATLSVVGIWRNMPALGDDLTDAEFRLSIVYAIVGTFGLGAITAVGTQTED